MLKCRRWGRHMGNTGIFVGLLDSKWFRTAETCTLSAVLAIADDVWKHLDAGGKLLVGR